jgi:hypothetical protein
MPNENKWLGPVKTWWRPQPLEPPRVDPELPELNPLQRSAESLRYSTLKTEYWISAGGTLREWLRLNCWVSIFLGIPALIVVPVITFLLNQFTTWTALLVQIAKNLVIFPIIAVLAIALITAVLFVVRFLISSR